MNGCCALKKRAYVNGNCLQCLLAKRTSVTIVNDLLCLQLETWNIDNTDLKHKSYF